MKVSMMMRVAWIVSCILCGKVRNFSCFCGVFTALFGLITMVGSENVWELR